MLGAGADEAQQIRLRGLCCQADRWTLRGEYALGRRISVCCAEKMQMCGGVAEQRIDLQFDRVVLNQIGATKCQADALPACGRRQHGGRRCVAGLAGLCRPNGLVKMLRQPFRKRDISGAANGDVGVKQCRAAGVDGELPRQLLPGPLPGRKRLAAIVG